MDPIKQISEKCTACFLCLKDCAFLKKFGHPKTIVDNYDPDRTKDGAVSFECSLCGLCAALCPEGIDPSRMFLEMRREAVRLGQGEFPKHKASLNFEKRGVSERYTWVGLPGGCDTVLFPGCVLPGTRPETVITLYEHLRQRTPTLGVVLDCCTKPSLDLGRQDTFQAFFGKMIAYLLKQGIENVWVACPNCYKVFKEHGKGMSVKTVYEVLVENGWPETGNVSAPITIHDPCVVRFNSPIQEAVRDLVGKKGLTIQEMVHNRQTTLCCGEGGAVGFLSPGLAKNWSALREEEAQGRRMITYCAGCVHHLNPLFPTSHVLDLLFQPEATLAGKVKVSRSPFTYWNRLQLKRKFKKIVPGAISRERVLRDG